MTFPAQVLTMLFWAKIDAKRVLREIIIMKNLEHENILGLLDVVFAPKEG